jgi:Serpin (serine protease inhibitor)
MGGWSRIAACSFHFALCCALLVACRPAARVSIIEEGPDTALDPLPLTSTQARRQLSDLNARDRQAIAKVNTFGFKLFSRLAAGEQGNLFVSPLNGSTAFTMAYNGDGGGTESEMAGMLGYGGMGRDSVNAGSPTSGFP